MSDCRKYVDYIMEQAKNLLVIDSPFDYGRKVTEYLLKELEILGMSARRTVKGGVIVDFGGRNREDGILLEAYCDTPGGMVVRIKENGELKLVNVGGMKPANTKAENVWIITKADRIYEGICQSVDTSAYVNGSCEETKHTWDTVEVLADEDVKRREDVVKLSIIPGDYVCFEPRTGIISSGYAKSRFLDDKLSAVILLGYAKYVKNESVNPERRVYAHFTIYEEVGRGGATSVPEGATETWSVDIGCMGEGLQCTECEVSTCAKGSGGPYNYDIVCRLTELVKEHGISCAVDVYPHYGSDVETTLEVGCDVYHALIGSGVYASHGYERSHRDDTENMLGLIWTYVG